MNIMFVCTGNVTRSMSAEYLLKKLLHDKGIRNWNVFSSGLRHEDWPHNQVLRRLEHYGCRNVTQHFPQTINHKLIDKSDIVICMTRQQKQLVEEHFHIRCHLYNEMAVGQTSDVYDETESPDFKSGTKDLATFLNELVDYLHATMPRLLQSVQYLQAHAQEQNNQTQEQHT